MLNTLKSNVRIRFKIIYKNKTMSTRVTLHLHLVAGNMVIIQIFCVKSFTAHFTIESIYPSMFRLMILLPLSTPENLAAELAGKSTAFVASHVQLVVVAVVVALPTNAAEMGILSSVMLGVLFKTTFRCECLVAFLAFHNF